MGNFLLKDGKKINLKKIILKMRLCSHKFRILLNKKLIYIYILYIINVL